MPMNFIESELPGVLFVEPRAFEDERGYFMETYHQRSFLEGGVACTFVQDNFSRSRKGTLRGLHYQLRHPQAKLVYVISGEVFDVAVDIRRGSPTFGKWVSAVLSGENHRQIFVPAGFAHGFCVISERADVVYKCTDFYAPGDEYGIHWSDPDLAIPWPVAEPLLSPKDAANPRLADVPEALPGA